MAQPPDEPLLLTVNDAVVLLNVSRNSIYRLLKAGDLTSMTIGKKRLIPRQEIERFIQERTSQHPVTKE